MQKRKNLKKLVASILVAGSICAALPFSVSAATTSNSLSQEANEVLISESVEYLQDGSYITTQMYKSQPSVLARAATYQQPASKVLTYTDNNGKLHWKYTLAATFTVNPGVSATCKSATGVPSISDNSWSVVSNKPSGSGNKATGTITMQRKVLGVVTNTTTKTLTITCDANGNLK